jgi:hypothetical protein
MEPNTWIDLSPKEKALLLQSLSLMRVYHSGGKRAVHSLERLEKKLSTSRAHPGITVGVYGGQVQWVLGNPFPVRICDYDGEGEDDLPDTDERGQRCRMWFEPVDAASPKRQS